MSHNTSCINSEKYWSDADDFFKSYKQIDSLAKVLVSLQFIPSNTRFLSAMQTVHWRGFGGAGEIFFQHKELRDLAGHAFSHHGGYETGKSFGQRLAVFKAPLDTMLFYTQQTIIDFLNQQYSHDEIYLYDFCSGPRFIAVQGVIEKMKDRKFNLVVSDVDGCSLLSLLKEKTCNRQKNLNFNGIRYDDLMLPLRAAEDEIEKYDWVSVNLGLHQLPLENIYTALKHFTKITKIGGIISNLDASERRYKQLMMIPGNLVDREGYVLNIEDIELENLVMLEQKDHIVTLPYPIIKLTKKIINSIPQNIGVGPYMVAFYMPVKIKLVDFEKLNILWKLKQHEDCDQIISQYILNFKNL
ncbi:MAG: hypothetical protein K2X39_00295 [Silvanigrellaceae bacterium]|nr:hypothetical protein [Silvanigrellaceae bacterium]